MRKLTGKNKKNILRPVHWVLTAGCFFVQQEIPMELPVK